jgi:hypothetical protein
MQSAQAVFRQGSGCASGLAPLAAIDPGLRAVLVFGPGVEVNGSALVEGIAGMTGEGVPILGGLAGDGGAFRETWTLCNDGVQPRQVVAVGLYGDALVCAHGSSGGW